MQYHYFHQPSNWATGPVGDLHAQNKRKVEEGQTPVYARVIARMRATVIQHLHLYRCGDGSETEKEQHCDSRVFRNEALRFQGCSAPASRLLRRLQQLQQSGYDIVDKIYHHTKYFTSLEVITCACTDGDLYAYNYFFC